MPRLENQVALVTGGASGLGLAIVERFIAEGARVAVFDKSAPASASLQDRFGDKVVTVSGDVRAYADNDKAVTACVEAFGKLDCAIGNAGIWDYNAALVDMPADNLDQSFDELFQVNVKGYIHLTKAALRPLVKTKGSIIFTVSNAGFYPAGGGVLYTASKHAVVGLIRQLAFELAPQIRVNGVAPGAIATKLKGPQAMGLDEAEFPVTMLQDMVPKLVPVGVMPRAEDYTGAYVFFASRHDNIPATGAVLNHDGGFGVAGLSQSRAGDDLPQKLGLT